MITWFFLILFIGLTISLVFGNEVITDKRFGVYTCVILCLIILLIFGSTPLPSNSDLILRTESIPIYSLNLRKDIHSSFILGTGGTYSNREYYYFRSYDGGKLLDSRSATTTPIIENDELSPCLQIVTKTAFNKFWNLFDSPIHQYCKYRLIVPTNSIKLEYNVDINKE